MNLKRGWIIFFIIVVAALLFLEIRFMGFATVNTTSSNVTITGANSPPTIDTTIPNLEVCEGENLFHLFYASDVDGDSLSGTISPSNPFYVFWLSQSAPNTHEFSIVSGTLDKTDLDSIDSGYKIYEETITVTDSYNATCCTDTTDLNITVVEKNNVPSVENIGVNTIWNQGDNTNFYELWDISDTEFDGGYGNLTYNISIVNSTGDSVSLFGINSLGVMNFTANLSTVIDTYNVSVCVQDTALSSPHVNISSVCSQDGGNFTRCDDFQLTVTDSNRAPNITDYYPTNLTFNQGGTTTFYFNITEEDPDGTIPDAYWYLDDVSVEYDSGSYVDEFSHNFGCGVAGDHTVRVDITDGELNDSLQWNFSVTHVDCPVDTGGGGGGGGGGVAPRAYFEVEPEFISTTLFEQEGKTFSIVVNNTGGTSASITTEIENMSNMAILSEDEFTLEQGESRELSLYLYALSSVEPGVYFGKVKFKAGSVERIVSVVVEVKEREPLFDLKVRVPLEYKSVYPDNNFKALVDLLNVGLYGTPVDVELTLMVTDLNRIILYETQREFLAVETNLTVERGLYVPFGVEAGPHVVLAELKYNNITISSYDTFNVIEKKYLRVSYFIIILVVLALIAMILFIIYKRRKREEEEKG